MAAKKRAGRPIELTIAGRRADYDELNAEIEELAVEAGAVLAGNVSDGELQELHAAAAATVFGSWEEGFGLPVLESLWHGLPCLCHAAPRWPSSCPEVGSCRWTCWTNPRLRTG